MSSPSQFHFIVSKDEAGTRLDRFLAQKIPHLSRSQLKHLIESGQVTLRGNKSKASYLIKKNEEIRLEIPPSKPLKLTGQAIPLDILYEDDCLLVVNKSAEMIVHPGAGIQEGTLVNAILYHCKNLPGIGGVLRPGIVHRLDKGTSGVLVVAKNDLAHHSLSAQFKSHQVEKKYQAFVWGKMRQLEGKIDLPLGRSLKNRKKISVRSRHTRHAITCYKVLKGWEGVSLLELTPTTGRTHQIRVHLSEIGHPVVGDPVYGRGLRRLSSLSPELQEAIKKFPFQLLHACSLSFRHPVTEKKRTFQAELRNEMLDFRKMLERNEK